LHYLLDEPLRLLEEQFIEHDMGDLAFFKPAAEELRAAVEQVPRTAQSYGLIHADLNPKNIHFDEHLGFTLIDFDHSAFGYRAYDLVPFRSYHPKTWTAFLAGYESLRPLLSEEKAALPAFAALRYIWDYGDIFAMLPVWGKTASKEGLERARQRLQSLTVK
jgi:Ser/Thr protein kinase RdoA (MazF antagonist)